MEKAIVIELKTMGGVFEGPKRPAFLLLRESHAKS